jgi:hypothetical protein
MKKNFMKKSVILIIGALLISCNQIVVSQATAPNRNKWKFSELKGPYLGQKPPGMKAEMFAPGLLTAGGHESKIAFSPDGKEFSISISTSGWQSLAEPRGAFRKGFMMHSRMENGYWTEPKEFSFSPARNDGYPFFSPDGNKLFFNSNRGRTDPSDKSSSGIWYVVRVSGGWSEPQEVDFGKDYQSGRGVFPSVAANGNLYFALWPTIENGFLYMSRYENGNYSSPERLSDAINDKGGNHPYIAPDESYIIFDDDRSENNFGQLDLFISFRDENGKWMKVQNLGEGVNTVYGERRPFVSFDGKYLFFSSDRINPELPEEPISLKKLQQLTNVHANGYQHIYWVDAKIIEELKLKSLK